MTTRAMPWVYDDGGRAEAGFKGDTRDCVTRAVAIAAQLPYGEVYEAVKTTATRERPRNGRRRSAPRTGVSKATTRRLLSGLGWTWTPTMAIGSGCQVHLRPDELPSGRLVVQLSGHVAAVVDGVVHDTFDPSRDSQRCVYGYWQPSE